MKARFIFLFFLLLGFVSAQNTMRDIDSIKSIIKTTKRPDRLAAEKATLAFKYFSSGDSKKAKTLYKLALNEAINAKADSGLATLYHTQGNIFYYESIFDSALTYYE